MKYVEGQLAQLLGYLLLDHAEITSGAYKMRTTQRGCGRNEDGTTQWRDLTEDEKLKDCLDTMKRRIHLIGETIEYLEGGSKWYEQPKK